MHFPKKFHHTSKNYHLRNSLYSIWYTHKTVCTNYLTFSIYLKDNLGLPQKTITAKQRFSVQQTNKISIQHQTNPTPNGKRHVKCNISMLQMQLFSSIFFPQKIFIWKNVVQVDTDIFYTTLARPHACKRFLKAKSKKCWAFTASYTKITPSYDIPLHWRSI